MFENFITNFCTQNGETTLHLAAKAVRTDVAKNFLDIVKKNNDEHKVREVVNARNQAGETALHYISRTQNIPGGKDREMTRLLLENGADPMLVTKKAKETSLHYISQSGNEDVLNEVLAFMSPEMVCHIENGLII